MSNFLVPLHVLLEIGDPQGSTTSIMDQATGSLVEQRTYPIRRAMTMEAQFRALDEVELLEFFGVEPVARTPEDGYWCYEISDARGVTLRFSFNLYERSVQT